MTTKQTGIRFRLLPPAKQLDGQLATRSFDRMPLEQAIAQLLGRTNAAMVYTSRLDPTGRE